MAKVHNQKPPDDDPIMAEIREWWKGEYGAEWTLESLGMAMWPDGNHKSKRQAAHQFLKSHDPRISSVRRFCNAVGVPMGQFVYDAGN